jgi:hypothetical protein
MILLYLAGMIILRRFRSAADKFRSATQKFKPVAQKFISATYKCRYAKENIDLH